VPTGEGATVRVLDGVRVLEACEGTAGRVAGLFLAELGADVVALEWADRALSPAVVTLLRSKASVAVPGGDAGRSLVDGLRGRADVVVCDLPDERRAALGLDPDGIRSANPAAIVADVTPYGRAGPLAGMPGDSQVAAALSGAVGSQWAYRDGGTWVVADIGAHMAGMQTAAGVVASLVGQARDGAARPVATSLLGGWLGLRAVHAVNGEQIVQISVADPQGGLSPVMRLYEAGDGGWIMLSCSTPEFWTKLCVALGLEDVLVDPRFEHAPLGIPAEHKPAIVELLKARLASDGRDAWLAQLRAHDVPCAPAQSPDEAMHDAQLEFNHGVVDVDQPGLGPTRQVAFPIRIDGVDGSVKNPAPAFGADTDAVAARWSARPATAGHADVAPGRPLAGVRVLEICDWVIGPYAGAILRQLGAEVWKVEAIAGDSAQLLSFVYLPMNSGKDVLRIDLGRPEGQAVLADLIRGADVVMHNHRPKGAKRLGFDADAVRALNPQAVYHEMVSFGRGGPLAGDPAFDHLVAARAGFPWIQGGMSAGHPPVLFNGSSGDLPGGIVAVLAVCAGLLRRSGRSGVTTSWSALFESGYLLNLAEGVLYDGRPPRPEGGPDHLGPGALRRLYRSADGWLLLSVTEAGVWRDTVELLGLDPVPFADAVDAAAEGDLSGKLAARLAERSGADWEAAAVAAAVPLVVPRIDREVIVEPHVTTNGYQSAGEHPELGGYRYPAHLVQVGGRPEEPTFAPPDPAASATRVLGGLGYAAERLRALAADGVIVA